MTERETFTALAAQYEQRFGESFPLAEFARAEWIEQLQNALVSNRPIPESALPSLLL